MNNLFDNDGTDVDCRHIDVLDGIRALSVLIVVWFHIWQQNWLMPILNTPALSFLRINSINLDWLPRTGYMLVNMLIFLSGFCLYLPYARHTIYGEKMPSMKVFFRRRIARIVPSYVFCVLVVFIYNIITGAYTAPDYAMSSDSMFMWKDLITRLTFTSNLFPDTIIHSLLNGALWTVALEVQFYIVFPLFQKAFMKKPVITYTAMTLASFVYIFWANGHENLTTVMHQLPSYLGIYANGFMGALIFTGITKTLKRNKYVAILSTIVSITCIYVYYFMMSEFVPSQTTSNWQLHYRYHLSLLFIVFAISTAYSVKFYRKIFSNRAAVFFSAISYNLYMWHQVIGITLKKHHIPYWSGDTEPNVLNDRPWMWKHFILSMALSLIVATLTTYFIEKPLSKMILRPKKKE